MPTLVSRKIAAAALVVAALSGGPALAGGSVGLTITPGSSDAERALRAGLALYGIANDIRSSGSIRQHGRGNAAGLRQDGGGHFGVIHQEGRGHRGTISQTGRSNGYGLFQFGRNTDADIRQSGDGGSGLTFQFGF